LVRGKRERGFLGPGRMKTGVSKQEGEDERTEKTINRGKWTRLEQAKRLGGEFHDQGGKTEKAGGT